MVFSSAREPSEWFAQPVECSQRTTFSFQHLLYKKKKISTVIIDIDHCDVTLPIPALTFHLQGRGCLDILVNGVYKRRIPPYVLEELKNVIVVNAFTALITTAGRT